MPVITMASSKGGVGKTTTALLLGLEFARSGATVALIDGDRNAPLSKWAALDGKPENITVIVDSDGQKIGNTIRDAATKFAFVIVDLEGSTEAHVTIATSYSDIVIVPMQSSIVDAHQATRTVKTVRMLADRLIRCPQAVLLTTKAPNFISAEAKAVREDLEESGFVFLPVVVNERVAYRSLFSYGGDLHSLPAKQVGNIEAARHNAQDLADSVLEHLRTNTGSAAA
jgi:chromosome partitioning protein